MQGWFPAFFLYLWHMCGCSNSESSEPVVRGQVNPDIWDKIKDVSSFIGDVLTGDLVNQTEYLGRISECLHCPHRVNNSTGLQSNRVKKTDQCSLCGCFVKAKAWGKSMRCDDGRWPELKNISENA